MEHYSKIAEENTVVLETELRRVMSSIEADYQSKIDEIKAKY